MQAYMFVLLYVFDEVTSLMTPVASGMFAVFAIIYCMVHPAARLAAPPVGRIRLVFFTLFVAGTIGALLSGTWLSPLSVLTVLLLYGLWTAGARLPPLTRLIKPGPALFGVLLAVVFLVLAQFELDLYSTLRGIPANRAAGLFLEPSHLALYVLPLWLIAFAQTTFRPLLWACLLLFVATQFTFSMVAVIGGFVALKLLLDSESLRDTLISMLKAASVVGALLLLIFSVPDLLVINDIELATYIENRIFGFAAEAGDDNFNLSPLVIVQGIEIAGLSLSASSGLGVGLGNMGVNEAIFSQSATRDILVSVTADFESLNIRDGGILLNKLTAEAGVFVLLLLWLIARAIFRIRRLPRSQARHLHLVFGGLMLALLLVRAIPYFAAPTCLVILSLASLTHSGRKRRRRKRKLQAAQSNSLRPAGQLG